MSELNDVIGGDTIAAAFTNQVKERTAMRYASAAARDTSIPAPIDGSLAFLQDTFELTLFRGGTWIVIFTTSAGQLNDDLSMGGNDIINVKSLKIDAASGNSLTLGRTDNVASTPFFDFNAGAVTVDRDARIVCLTGTGTNDGGHVAFQLSLFEIVGLVQLNSGAHSQAYDTSIGVFGFQHRDIFASTAAPTTEGKDGDVWLEHAP